jgi:hypothetical protein
VQPFQIHFLTVGRAEFALAEHFLHLGKFVPRAFTFMGRQESCLFRQTISICFRGMWTTWTIKAKCHRFFWRLACLSKSLMESMLDS